MQNTKLQINNPIQSKVFFETYAKLILEWYCDKKRLNIEDRPDLRSSDGSFGVEVASCMPSNIMEGTTFAIRHIGAVNINNFSKKELEGFYKIGGRIKHDVSGNISEMRTISDVSLLNSIETRISDKLKNMTKKGYDIFESNRLFLFVSFSIRYFLNP